MAHRFDPESQRRLEPQPHEILGLSPREDDAVKVIEVAQTLLRRWRRMPLAAEQSEFSHPAWEARNRIREIVAAREAMLQRIQSRWCSK